jgi:hypothetical protein
VANLDQIAMLQGQGVEAWNRWKELNPLLRPDLSEANLEGLDLRGVNLGNADLFRANLAHTQLDGANLHKAHLREANLEGATLRSANLRGAHLREAVLRHATLAGADLSFATLVMAHVEGADFTGASIYGISAWAITRDDATQQNGLVISGAGESPITVDDLEVAQFIYLLLNNQRVRQAIDTITSKAVLILGRFTPERKLVLDALREELRRRGYLPMLFDFDPAASQSRMETVSTLAHLARFVIADITDAKTVLQELQGIVPQRPSLPVQPILLSGQKEPGMFDVFYMYPWFLPTVYYDSPQWLLARLNELVIAPAEGKAQERALRLEELRRTP